ncbi:MAG: glycoside hydrolase family 88 protein [Bacteroidales bacterium]|nr:glycoside hydrolase family 88 protein [Bacteroidales bacterium]
MKKMLIPVLLVLLAGCTDADKDFVRENVKFAAAQVDRQIAVVEDSTGVVLNPLSVREDGTIRYCKYTDWRSGFFPGTVWYLYELTGDEKYLPLARKYTEAISDVQYVTDNHDVGFMTMSGFGNGLRIAGIEEYKGVIVQAARSLMTRFRRAPGVFQSWEANPKRDWKCPVIIDNMMNLELLFKAFDLTGDSTFVQAAVSHADRTLKEHFRPDGSCYHVLDYDPESGEVRMRVTKQGFADESIWSRGQAWAVYGYAAMYRHTGDRKYLEQSLKTFDMLRNHPDLPEDCIFWWDMCAPDIPDAPRDASSAAIVASALYDICTMDVDNPEQYKAFADRIMASLASPAYRAALGENGNFILMHSSGNVPAGLEIDVPLNYADYYFLEALVRKSRL